MCRIQWRNSRSEYTTCIKRKKCVWLGTIFFNAWYWNFTSIITFYFPKASKEKSIDVNIVGTIIKEAYLPRISVLPQCHGPLLYLFHCFRFHFLLASYITYECRDVLSRLFDLNVTLFSVVQHISLVKCCRQFQLIIIPIMSNYNYSNL